MDGIVGVRSFRDMTKMMMRFSRVFFLGAVAAALFCAVRYIVMEKTVTVEAQIVAKCADPGTYKGDPLHCNKYHYTYNGKEYAVWGAATAREDTDKPVGTILPIEILPSDPNKVIEMPDLMLLIAAVTGGTALFAAFLLIVVAGPQYRKRILKSTGVLSTGYVTKVKRYYGNSPSGAILVRAKAPDGSVQTYKSEYIYLVQATQFEPTRVSKPVPVDVYVDPRNYHRGYVDVLAGPSAKPLDKGLNDEIGGQ